MFAIYDCITVISRNLFKKILYKQYKLTTMKLFADFL